RHRVGVVGVGVDQASPAAPDPDDLVPLVVDPVDHRLDAGVQPGDVAPAGEDADAHAANLRCLGSGGAMLVSGPLVTGPFPQARGTDPLPGSSTPHATDRAPYAARSPAPDPAPGRRAPGRSVRLRRAGRGGGGAR